MGSGRAPDAIVTDLRMLDGSGNWLLEQLARYYPGLVARTVILTGDDRRSPEGTGSRPVLTKPVDFDELLRALDGAVRAGAPLTPPPHVPSARG